MAWLHITYQGGIPAQRRSPIPVLTGLSDEQLRSYDERRYHSAKPLTSLRLFSSDRLDQTCLEHRSCRRHYPRMHAALLQFLLILKRYLSARSSGTSGLRRGSPAGRRYVDAIDGESQTLQETWITHHLPPGWLYSPPSHRDPFAPVRGKCDDRVLCRGACQSTRRIVADLTRARSSDSLQHAVK